MSLPLCTVVIGYNTDILCDLPEGVNVSGSPYRKKINTPTEYCILYSVYVFLTLPSRPVLTQNTIAFFLAHTIFWQKQG